MQDEISSEKESWAVDKAMQSVKTWLPKSTCIVVGPGLGTDDLMHRTALAAIQEARQDVRNSQASTGSRTPVMTS
jgi:hypothetical protein